MDSNSWSNRLSSASTRRHHHPHHSRSDLFVEGGGFDETDGDEDLNALFLCPFCAEDFDIVGLCCHVKEDHPVEAKSRICPVCARRVGTDIVSHITVHHGNIFKIQRKRRLRRGAPHSTFSLLRKELRDENLQSLIDGSSCFVSSSNIAADPLLSSFIFNSPNANETLNVQLPSISEPTSLKESSKENLHERHAQQPLLSDKDKEERARECEFVQGLVLSTILGDYL